MERYAEPYSTPEDCDHDPSRPRCSRCCPCPGCGEIRADELADACCGGDCKGTDHELHP